MKINSYAIIGAVAFVGVFISIFGFIQTTASANDSNYKVVKKISQHSDSETLNSKSSKNYVADQVPQEFDSSTIDAANRWFSERSPEGVFALNSKGVLIFKVNQELDKMRIYNVDELRGIIKTTDSKLAKFALFEKLSMQANVLSDKKLEMEINSLALDLAAYGNTNVIFDLSRLYAAKAFQPEIKTINGKEISVYSLNAIKNSEKYMTLLNLRGDVGLIDKNIVHSNFMNEARNLPNSNIIKITDQGRKEGYDLFDKLNKFRAENGLSNFNNLIDPSAEKLYGYLTSKLKNNIMGVE